MILLKKVILSTPVTDTNGETYKRACIGLYEVYVTGRHSYLDVGFEVYKTESECNNEATPIRVDSIGNSKKFDLAEEEFVEGADWEDIAADKMVDYITELFSSK